MAFRRWTAVAAALLAPWAAALAAGERGPELEALYVSSPPSVVAAMLKLAAVSFGSRPLVGRARTNFVFQSQRRAEYGG